MEKFSMDIRWKQRFQNFSNAFSSFQEANNIKTPSKIEEAGLIQIFEYTFELGWKVLKDYLESHGYNPKFPRDTIKLAFQTQLITDGHTWLDALEKRNLMAHTYNEKTAQQAINLIKTHYFKILSDLHASLKAELNT